MESIEGGVEKMNNYKTDFYGWSKEQSCFLKDGVYSKLDIENLIEEIESLGRSEKRTLISYLCVNFLHQLKFQYQPEKMTRSWDISIKASLKKAWRCLEENPSLKFQLVEICNSAYEDARYGASQETDLDLEIFPKNRIWKAQQVFEQLEKKYWED